MLLASTAAVSVWTLVSLRREDPTDLTRFLQLLLVAVLAWTTMAFFDGLGISPSVTYAFTKLTYLGIPVVPTAWLLVALEYSDRVDAVSDRLLAGLAVEPVLVNVVVWTNGSHELFWELDWSRAVTPIVDGGHGVLFFAHVGYMYVVTMVGVAVMVDVIRRRERLFRRQSLVLGACAVVPMAANVLFVAEVVAVDPTPPAFLVSGIAFYWVVSSADVASVSPIARQTVIDTMAAGMFVVRDGRLVDVNRQARRLFGVDEDADVVGDAVVDHLPDSVLFARFDGVVETTETVAVDTQRGREHYQVDVSPVVDGDERVGRLFLVQDVTERVERERELERKNDQLEGFASVVSHDLRNPLNVAGGYVELIESTTDDEAVREYAAEAATATERMETLIEDILAMAREGDVVENPDPVGVWTVAQRAWGTVDTAEMTLEAASEAATTAVVLADADRLQRLFENVFRNAREHAGEAVTVTVGVDGFDDETVLDVDDRAFWVADDGPGLPADDADSVLEEGFTTNDDGTGFGLAIVREIAEGHGWTVVPEESESGGAKFRFLGVATADQTAVATADDD
ncbi:histidine kinase N-terminal 7TM domain-containing protein [Halorubellus litoreus]|uniref:histidine kinase n=1 Tax=Halorubellus litoreus TaxID=755308 RepID=A0ABD5VJB7_9EURY